MLRRTICSLLLVTSAVLGAPAANAQATPDAMIKQVANEVIDAVKADKAIQAGDLSRIQALVETKVMPHVDFQRMTSAAMGKYWRQATPEQRQRLEAEFKLLLIRTYAGALTQVKDQTTVTLKPLRAAAEDANVTVRTEIKGNGEPVQLDYRVEKEASEWKILDVNVLGVWLVDQYKGSFAQEIAANGIDGLITKLAAKNKGPAAPTPASSAKS